MIAGIVGKKLLGVVMKGLLKQFDLYKIRKYVDEENDADLRINDMEIEIAKLKQFSHSPIFSETDKSDIIRRLVRLENHKKRRL